MSEGRWHNKNLFSSLDLLSWSLCLMTYQTLLVTEYQNQPCKRTVLVLINKRIFIFIKGISMIVNVIALREFEVAYNDVVALHISRYATKTPPPRDCTWIFGWCNGKQAILTNFHGWVCVLLGALFIQLWASSKRKKVNYSSEFFNNLLGSWKPIISNISTRFFINLFIFFFLRINFFCGAIDNNYGRQ